MYCIGVDIGGTNIKIGLFRDKDLIDKIVTPTNVDNVVEQLQNLLQDVLSKNNIPFSGLDKISIGCPGIVCNGVILASVNLNLNNCQMQKIMEEKFKCLVYVTNDVNMSAISEKNIGAGKGAQSFVMLTVGTGIGGSIVIDGKLYEGNGAGEFGHMIFERNGKECSCGRYGCAEKYLSLIALSDMAKDFMQGKKTIIPKGDIIRASDIADAYAKGDVVAKSIVEKYASDFSEYLLDICNCLRPDKILIGGGLSYAPAIIENIAHLCKVKGFGYPNSHKVDVEIAKLGNDAGIYGVLFVK